MTLQYYHAEPVANSLKSMIPLIEKGLPYRSVYVDLHKFEQHSDWFVAINPEGQVPVLDHDGIIITHTTVITEYLEDAKHKDDLDGALFRPVKNNITKILSKHLHPDSVYHDIVKHYGSMVGINTLTMSHYTNVL